MNGVDADFGVRSCGRIDDDGDGDDASKYWKHQMREGERETTVAECTASESKWLNKPWEQISKKANKPEITEKPKATSCQRR